MLLQAQSLLGLIAIPLIAWGLSENRHALSTKQLVRIAGAGIGLQLLIAAAMLNIPMLRDLFDLAASAVGALQAASNKGMQLVFGYLAGAPAPFETIKPENSFVLAFQALPLILLISALTKLLYYFGILQAVVRVFAILFSKAFGISGPLGTATAANIFVGMVEAPLFIRPYLEQLTRSQLFAVMTVGMATVAGTVLALYASVLTSSLAGAAGHLIVASVISAPAALMLALLMVPPEEQPESASESEIADSDDDRPRNAVDALAQGTRDGLILLAHVAAMLIVFVALVALVNQALGAMTGWFGTPVRIEQIFGWICAPLAWLTGISWSEAVTAGGLIGVKTVLNELVAYLQLAATPADALSDRSRLIMTYVLCGFANFGSLGIMIGGLIAIVPDRRSEIASLGAKSLISGTLATLMTGAVIGLLSVP